MLKFFNKSDKLESINLKSYILYNSVFGLSKVINVFSDLNDKKLLNTEFYSSIREGNYSEEDSNNEVLKKVNKKYIGKFPNFLIKSLNETETSESEHTVEFNNEIKDLDSYRYVNDGFSLYYIGLETLIGLQKLSLFDFTKFKIMAKANHSVCEYCGSSFHYTYRVTYEDEVLFETKHNGFCFENNVPFLYNRPDDVLENPIVNINIIYQLCFEAIKHLKLINSYEFLIYETKNEVVDKLKLSNIKDFEIVSSLMRSMNKDDCCIGFGKDSFLNKAIIIYKNLFEKNLNETIITASRKYVKIKKEENKLKFLDFKNNEFGSLSINKTLSRIDILDKINIFLNNHFNHVWNQ